MAKYLDKEWLKAYRKKARQHFSGDAELEKLRKPEKKLPLHQWLKLHNLKLEFFPTVASYQTTNIRFQISLDSSKYPGKKTSISTSCCSGGAYETFSRRVLGPKQLEEALDNLATFLNSPEANYILIMDLPDKVGHIRYHTDYHQPDLDRWTYQIIPSPRNKLITQYDWDQLLLNILPTLDPIEAVTYISGGYAQILESDSAINKPATYGSHLNEDERLQWHRTAMNHCPFLKNTRKKNLPILKSEIMETELLLA